MERKEQERLEEILAMCAQYEEQIDSEIQLNAAIQSSSASTTNSPPPVYSSLFSSPKPTPSLTTTPTTSLNNMASTRTNTTNTTSTSLSSTSSTSTTAQSRLLYPAATQNESTQESRHTDKMACSMPPSAMPGK